MFGYLKRGESLILWFLFLFFSLSLEGALSPFLGPLTPDLTVITVLISSCCLSERRGLLFAFVGGFLLDLRWQSVVGFSSLYLVCMAYILKSLIGSHRLKINLKTLFIGIGALVFFQLFKMGFYKVLRLEYDADPIILLGRVLLDTLILCFVLFLMKVGGSRRLEV